MTQLEPATPADAATIAALWSEVVPFQVRTAAGMRHWLSTAPPAERMLSLLALDDGDVVGFGMAHLESWTSETAAAWLTVMVLPEHRSRGIGRSIYDALMAHLVGVGARKVQLWSYPDVSWAERLGFVVTHELRYLRADLTALPPMPTVPVGVTTKTASDFGPEGMYALDSLTLMDAPSDVAHDAVPYDEWLDQVWRSPAFDWDLATVVLVEGQPAAYTMMEADPATGRVWAGGTGTVRSHRGRGLAKIAKSVGLRAALKAGYHAGLTCNDETNVPMLAINTWLGYDAAGVLTTRVRMFA